MLQTLNPYTTTAKTAEIMARYRPIAPRPQTTNGGTDVVENSSSGSCLSMTPSIRQSPYLRNVWPYMQSRPTRTRKRGRIGAPVAGFKRPRSLLQGLSPAYNQTQVFAPPTRVTLPLIPCSSSTNHMQIDLNDIPEEKDLLAQLQQPNLFSPTPMRLTPSTVMIRAIKNNEFLAHTSKNLNKKSDIETDLESQALPGFVTDANNQVRLVNPAYEKMVGQPECTAWRSQVAACKSISGDVVLKFGDEEGRTYMVSSTGFSCWARIEWEVNGNKTFVNAFGEARRLLPPSNYNFTWRFHTKEPSEAALNL